MHFTHRLRLPALFCSAALLVCALISRPFVDLGICDDWPYILSAQKLAATGHIVYNGGATAMLGWQLFLGAAFLKVFGAPFTAPRMGTLAIGMLIAFLLQRTLVRLGISERNAAIGTLAFVLSPIFLVLSVTFMSDVPGLFALVLCLYACVRAIQASSPRAAITWLLFAVISNTIGGSARQIAWLGVLVMVPSTLFLLRSQRRVLLAGLLALVPAVVVIFGSMRWFAHQPYSLPQPLRPEHLLVFHASAELFNAFLELPFLLLPLALLFLLKIPGVTARSLGLIAAIVCGYLFLALHPGHLQRLFPLQPTLGDWITVQGGYAPILAHAKPVVFLTPTVQCLFTIASLGGLLTAFALILQSHPISPPSASPYGISTAHLAILLGPVSLAYILLLLPLASKALFDRYLLAPMIVVLIFALRFYQRRICSRLPPVSILLVALAAVYAIVITHNTFSLYRARVAIAAELHRAGVPDTSIDNGWDYNFGTEILQSGYINDSRIVVPAGAYHPLPESTDPCKMFWSDRTPHIQPRYSIWLYPTRCSGPAPFPPVQYSRWLATPGTLYVVNMATQPDLQAPPSGP